MNVVKWSVAIAATTMLIACGQQDSPTSAKEELKSSGAEIRQESKQMARAVQDFTVEQKEEFQNKVQDQLDNLRDKISNLEDKSENVTGEAKAELQEATADLNQKLEMAKVKMQRLQNATADTWEDIKGNLSAAMQDVENAYNKAVARLQ